MINNSDSTIQARVFAEQNLNDTDVDTNVIGKVMTQQQPVCLHLLNGSAVSGFSVGTAESITLPLM